MLQYTIEPAYDLNYQVNEYNDGKVENREILAPWELSGYLRAIESRGYKRAYDVDTYRQNYEACLESLNLAKEELDRAIANPLIKCIKVK